MLLAQDGLIFVHIQKTGGSSVCEALSGKSSYPEKHRLALELREIYGRETWDSCYRFAFVRNPWDRLVSWWSMIDGQRNSPGGNDFFRYVLSSATTFEGFLHNCREEIADPDGRKCIYRNQIDYLRDDNGELLVDFIGRFENIEADFATVTHRIYGTPKSLPHSNPSVHKPYTEYYTPELIDLVAEAYATDIATFGYSFGD